MPKLPKRIDPILFADKGKKICGLIPLSECSRLADQLLGDEGMVAVSLKFWRDGATSVITGQIEAEVNLSCHFCVELLRYSVRCDVNLGIVRSLDMALVLPENLEPLIVSAGDSEIDLADLVQDELILALPMYPRHAQCAERSAPSINVRPVKTNPFNVLIKLKQD